MGLLSILPESFAGVELWLTRFFFLLGAVTIGPWAAMILYDLVLYVARSISHEIPVVGGRARGAERPRAPSLTEHPSGHRRRFSLARRSDYKAQSTGNQKSESLDPRWREIQEETSGYSTSD